MGYRSQKLFGWMIFFLGIIFNFALSSQLSAQNISVTTYIDQRSVVLNQAAELSVEISGADMNQVSRPELPDLGDWFSYTCTQSSSQNISIINGKVTSSVTYIFGIIPLKVGTATIPPVTVRIGDKTFKSAPVTVEIKDTGSAPQTQRNTRSPQTGSTDDPVDIFIVAIPDKNTVYQNEGITVEYKVYFGSGITIREYTPLNTPNTAGFWTEEYQMHGNPRARPELYNGQQYNAAVLKRVELFPTNSGEFELDPMQMKFIVRVPQRRSRSVFDDFDSFFNNPLWGSSKEVRVRSNSLKIAAKPLPSAARPASFNGEVGNYTISAAVDKNRVKAHESVTLLVKISGTGNIKLINEPRISIPEKFERYDPKIEEKINRTSAKIMGEKTFEYVFIPRREGSYTIGPVTFTYFEPEAAVYKIERTAPIRITVEPGDAIITGAVRNLTREEIKLVGQDIRFIKESVMQWHNIGQRQYFSASFVSMLLMPVLVVGLAFVYSRHLQRLDADAGYKRSRRATAVAAKRLKKAHTYLEKNAPDSFYPEIARVLQEYIADKLNIAAAGIVTGKLEKMLTKMHIDNDLVDAYVGCLKLCDFHRFASINCTQDEMRELYEDSRKAIHTMEERLKKAA